MNYGTEPVVFQGAGLGVSDVGLILDKLITRGVLREVGTATTKPVGIPEKSIDQVKSEFAPWYKKWWVWAIVGGGVVGTGLTVYFVRRR